jgi:ABC-2 type transport system ATP-binding protein
MIEVERLSKMYGSTMAIKDLSFKAEPGEILGLLGPNGAGKTTTMRILSGYLPATQGEARIAGYEVHENPMAVRRRIGYLPETPPLYLDMTVEGYLYFVSRIKGVPAGERAAKVTLALDRCNLLKKRRILIHKLSKGFRQRVGIAQAIVHDPPAIILDEPTVGLDPRQIIDVRNLIKTLAEDKTVVLSTHILPEVSMTCHRAVIINHGEVVAVESLEELMAQRTGSIVYDLELQTLPEEVETRLRHLDGLKTMKRVSADGAERQQVQITTAVGVELGPQIALALVESGIELYEMRRVAKSLEDVFLNLTTEEQAPADDADLDEEDS